MNKKILINGNEAIAEAAILAGCRFYAGYPITPQNQIPEYMSWRMPEAGGVFIQAESELAAINMVFGASLTGTRAMTSSSSPGISLKQEGISYMAGCELPGVIVNMQRGGPGLGNIQGSQADYFQATKGGGHGDYKMPVLAPSTIPEAIEHVMDAFDLADKYRTPVMILSDGILGQMMEAVEFPEYRPKMKLPKKDWILDGAKGRAPRSIFSLMMQNPTILEKHNWKLSEKFKKMEVEVRHETYHTEDAEILICAYGIMGRICKGAVDMARKADIKAGLFRPVTVWPFASDIVSELGKKAKKVLVVELNLGQMVEDIRLAVEDNKKISFHGRPGGAVATKEEVFEKIKELAK
ncbi:MAG: 3-methyl-2-oxobutanoate dehydrogenase subunit VorB [Candidatus Firestonebacteria bacterium RIFOXYC2_FULL_39_67]|nr:MAG: 3-methyl-2-oxobutanoate dehydrogenase subunit VorB [Candidatus Firestonebacteria bacterium RIFOXYD2_FULL_39_29]OGF56989.1 MAG: 3-methyl-2-oxobutanoate dehydrogenase subunit VorB [Candidatus Firestonebacteria bacterium RIFOXYC2_FULL_39_67]OGF58057.1 MAG: 3-methyl-2-oxobutanoate dehydrogenase subunit VorB [Candidatus Firestonebacteria bacterium RifOxyC12_full_39_7]